MKDIPNLVNPINGEFLATKLGNSKEEAKKIIEKIIENSDFYESNFWNNLDVSEKAFLKYHLDSCIESGYIPQSLLLTLIMPPCTAKFNNKPGGTITFKFPPKEYEGL